MILKPPASLLAGLAGILVLATVATSPPAEAQQPPLRIGIIDTERILSSSQTGKRALAEIDELQKQKRAEAEGLQREAIDLRTRIAEGGASLSPDALSQLEKELEGRLSALRQFQDDATRELSKRRDDVLGQIDQKVMPVINLLGAEQGYTLIFRKFESGLIYADEAVDITDQVIARLDAAEG